MKTIMVLVPIMALVGGCALASERLVAFPLAGQTVEKQAQDVAACEAFAEAKKSDAEVLKSIGVATAGGAASGVLAGAVLGALGTAGAGQGAGTGAAVGAAAGLIAGAWSAVTAERARYFRIYGLCMGNRGYQVGG